MLLKPKHVSTLPSYVDIKNGIFPNWLKKETKNPEDMDIQDEFVLHGMTWAAADDIEYNIIMPIPNQRQ